MPECGLINAVQLNGLAADTVHLHPLDGIAFAFELDVRLTFEGRLIAAGVQFNLRQCHARGGVIDGGFNGADRRIQCGLGQLALKNLSDLPGQIHHLRRCYRGRRGLKIGGSQRISAMLHKLRGGSGIQLTAEREKGAERRQNARDVEREGAFFFSLISFIID